jgi:protein-arginine kinase activator protein McsA
MMSNEEMEQLADLIVQKIFEAEERAQQEFMESYEIALAAQAAHKSIEDRINELEDELAKAIVREDYKAASEIKKKLDNLKNL